VRIGVDTTCWSNPRGYGRFTRELLPPLVAQAPADRFVCFLDDRSARDFSIGAPNVERRVVSLSRAPTEAASAAGSRSPFDMWRLSYAVARASLDVFFSPSVYTYFPLPPGLRSVITVHDAIAERFPHLTMPSRRARMFWKLKVALALRQATLVLTVSEFAAADIARVLRVDRKRIRVAVEAPAHEYRRLTSPTEIEDARRRLELPPDARWLVYVGGFNPHKNVDLLVRAHARLAEAHGRAAPFLVLVGPGARDVFHGNADTVGRTIDESGTGALVRTPGFLPDAALRPVLAGATAAVLPSMCEGFGLPAIEAAACGTPVVATRESPLPQLLEGGGVFIRPGDLDELTAALAEVSAPGARERLGDAARRRALALSWDDGAAAALAALREAVQ
jgi:glycosyltransferase involved in cell wall biosynthesis